MPTAPFQKFNVLTSDILKGNHKFGTDTIKLLLTNTAPVASNTIKANITEIATGNGYSTPTVTAAVTTASGVAKLTLSDTTITATGAVGPFRYAVVFNDTTSSPAKPLIGFIDYGSSITLANGDTMLADFDGTNGVLVI